jgi:starvation-inducible outer membrane lipoprotein
MRKALVGALALCLSGCASFPLTAKQECKYNGYQPGTPECTAFQQQRIAEVAQQSKDNTAIIGAIMLGKLYVDTAKAQGRANAYAMPLVSSPLPKLKTCPDGTPTYSERCFLAPNGRYVGGHPQIAPDGSFVGGTGELLLCANGTYVMGSRCQLLPDGTYIGVP